MNLLIGHALVSVGLGLISCGTVLVTWGLSYYCIRKCRAATASADNFNSMVQATETFSRNPDIQTAEVTLNYIKIECFPTPGITPGPSGTQPPVIPSPLEPMPLLDLDFSFTNPSWLLTLTLSLVILCFLVRKRTKSRRLEVGGDIEGGKSAGGRAATPA